ncbi:MAG: truncated hemoglobin, partial [Alcanivorax nanhaiticus]
MSNQQNNSNDDSLYSQVGGEPAIKAVVTEFYNRVLGDPSLAPFFRHKQRKGLEKSQVRFFSQALGGPRNYSGRT